MKSKALYALLKPDRKDPWILPRVSGSIGFSNVATVLREKPTY
jgi:hypothetical protein